MAKESNPVDELPEPLADVFRAAEPRELDDHSLQCLFLISCKYAMVAVPLEWSTQWEIDIKMDVFEEHGFSRADLWDGVYWPLDLPDSHDQDPFIEDLAANDIAPLDTRSSFPYIHITEADSDTEENLQHFRVDFPCDEGCDAIVDMIRNSETLKKALIDSAQLRGDHWAAVRAVACLTAPADSSITSSPQL